MYWHSDSRTLPFIPSNSKIVSQIIVTLALAIMLSTTIVGYTKDTAAPQDDTEKLIAGNGPFAAYDPGIEVSFGRIIDPNGESVVKLEEQTTNSATRGNIVMSIDYLEV